MRARVVIGANFGDEGKGLTTDYLCAQGAGVVVRFNGGTQAGHTVVTPEGRRHVFGHIGSGALQGIPTFLSQFFVVNPIMFINELGEFVENSGGMIPRVYASPDCLVTTFADMIINQRLEEARGANRHGSVGLGVGETYERSQLSHLRITMSDLWNKSTLLPGKIAEICDKYARYRTGSKIDEPAMIEKFIEGCYKFADFIGPAGIGQCKDPVFEGAQGLLLDQNNKTFFPHVTRSNTGSTNARILCAQAGIKDIDFHYVSRTYLTRHGAGPLPGEDPDMHFHDDTNHEHAWQGKLRFAPLDHVSLHQRCSEDAKGPFRLVYTHLDQCHARIEGPMYIVANGPTREHVVDLSIKKVAHG